MPKKTFQGQTQDAPFLGAAFWKKGIKVEGTVVSRFPTENGLSYGLRLNKKIQVNEAHTDLVSIGALKGFGMALRSAGIPDGELQVGDAIIAECIGFTQTDKGNPQVNFKVAVSRDSDF